MSILSGEDYTRHRLCIPRATNLTLVTPLATSASYLTR